MHFETHGTAEHPCVLLLHTMFTTGSLFKESILPLKDRYFLVVPTLDGYHPAERSEYPGADEELEQIEAFLRERQIRELEVATGSSLGAMLAWRLWQREHIPIRRLILDSPSFGWDSAVAGENTKSFWQLAQTVQAAPDTRCIFDEHYGTFGFMMRRSCAAVSENTIRRSCETCFGPQLPEHIQTGGTSILLVYGEDDPNYQENRKMLVGRTDVSLLVKPGYGHCGFLMHKSLEFAKMLMGG